MSNSEVQAPGPSFFFNIVSGELIVGSAAYEDRLEAGELPDNFLPLSEALTSPALESLQFPALDTKMDLRPWTKNVYVSHVAWLGKVIMPPGMRFTQEHLERAYDLGIGPSIKRMDHIGGVSELYELAGLKNVYKRGVYDGWTKMDIGEYVGRFAAKTPAAASLRKSIDEAARAGEGPSSKFIKRRMGSLTNAAAMMGYVETQTWDDEEYYRWGVNFMFANNGRQVDRPALSLLSPKRRSPSFTTISARFGIDTYRQTITEMYLDEKEKQDRRNEFKFQEVMRDIANGILPAVIFTEVMNEVELRHIAGKYRIVDELMPQLDDKQKIAIAAKNVKGMVLKIISASEHTLNAADIEEAAIMLDVFDDVWPMTAHLNGLKVD